MSRSVITRTTTMPFMGTISLVEPNSANAKKLADSAISTIGLLARLEQDFASITADAAQFGITRSEGETDVAFLKRVADAATRAHFSLRAEDEAKRVALIAEGKAEPRRTGLAGLLSRASDAVARI